MDGQLIPTCVLHPFLNIEGIEDLNFELIGVFQNNMRGVYRYSNLNTGLFISAHVRSKTILILIEPHFNKVAYVLKAMPCLVNSKCHN